ncbi:MAG: hypothetical protein EZS28_041070, partial [Streblomastix strix]
MAYNDAAEQILTLERIRAELQDPEQTKAQHLQAGFGEDDQDLSESLVSKPEKQTHAQQVPETAMDSNIKLEPNSQQSKQTQGVSRKKSRKETIKTLQEQIGEELGVNMRKWKQICYTERQGINQDATKYWWTGNEIPNQMQQEKTYIEKDDQQSNAITALSELQSTALTSYAKALEGKTNADECKHIFKLSTIVTNAIIQLREEINLPYRFSSVIRYIEK